MTSSSSSSNCRFQYCWIYQLKTDSTFIANSSRDYVRVMGIVVNVSDLSFKEQQLIPLLLMMTSHDTSMKLLTIDDGTDIISFWIPQSMTHELQIGDTYDCIVKFKQNASVKRWVVDTIIHINNPIEDEYLRWLMLSHQQEQKNIQKKHNEKQQIQSSATASFSFDYGYPLRKVDVKEVYRMICLHVQIQKQEHEAKEKTSTMSKLRTRQYTTNNVKRGVLKSATENAMRIQETAPVLQGLSIEDLSIVLQTPTCEIQNIVHDLQLQGQIYQNQQGQYLPL